MSKFRTIQFKILGFTPNTLPMARLAEYLSHYAEFLGHENAIHFRSVKEGSAACLADIDLTEFPSVRKRAVDAAKGQGPPDAIRGYRCLNQKLREDNTSAELLGERGKKLVRFPGVAFEEPETFGPFNEPGTLDGVLIRIGGKDQTIPVHIQDEGRTYICNATTRELARRLAPHLFGSPLRLHGTGRWTRDPNGVWTLMNFNIEDFEQLNSDELTVVVERLRAIPDDGWSTVKDPLAELRRIRRG